MVGEKLSYTKGKEKKWSTVSREEFLKCPKPLRETKDYWKLKMRKKMYGF